MTSWVLAFSACVVVVSAGLHQEGDEGEFGKDNKWRKVICEKKSDDLYQDIENCFQIETQLIRDSVLGCVKKIMPESNIAVTEFASTACNDKPLFFKFDECMEELESSEEFQKEEEISSDVKACYVELLNKHGLQELLHYLEEE